jgi:CubicO group peptidase (beta-lactamase class C family)
VVLWLAVAVTPGAAQRAPLEGLDAYIERAVKAWEVPGLAIAVVRNDTVLYERGFGVRELGRPERVDEHTLFSIASTTRGMTGAAIGLLVDEKKLAWDDAVAKHLPWFQLRDAYVTREVTVRDLLSHRAGVERSDNLWIAGPYERAEILRRARHLPTATSFRSAYGYNNIMFIAAGEVAGAVSGMSWDDFIEQRIFRPLGMSRSTTRMDVLATRDNVAAAHTRVDGRVQPSPLRDYDNIGGAGAVFSSAHDMAQWLRLHLAGGTFGGQRLMQPATLKEMYTPQTVIRTDTVAERMFPSTHFRAYGLGWFLEDYQGEKLVQHSGSLNWTRTQVGMIPARGIGVVAIANLSSSNLQLALMYRVLDALLGVPERDWSAEYLALARRAQERAAANPDSGRVKDTKPSLALDAYAGTYRNEVYGDVKVAIEDGRLVLRYAPDYVADLEHWNYDAFRGTWRRAGFGRAFVSFALDRRARPVSLTLDGFGEFRRVAEP